MTPAALRCPRCDRPASGFAGCPDCRAAGIPVNLVPPLARLHGANLADFPGGPWGWRTTLPVGGEVTPVTLGEGNTPLVQIAAAGRLLLKLEGANPTGSHKDRAMSVGITKAKESGADVVVISSSGNAGAAAAAYAARAGLSCVVTTTAEIPPNLHAQILGYGARLAVAADDAARAELTRRGVEELGWFPLANYVHPAVGGNPYANEGYKSIAYELARDAPQADHVVIPTCRADLLSGVARGYRELLDAGIIGRAPRLVAAETSTGAAFTLAMTLPDTHDQERAAVDRQFSPAFSIGSDNACWQGLSALWWSNGAAIAISPESYVDECRRLAATEGLFVEVSSAVAVSVARQLADADATVVAVATATGLKDPHWLLTDGAHPAATTPDELASLGGRQQ